MNKEQLSMSMVNTNVTTTTVFDSDMTSYIVHFITGLYIFISGPKTTSWWDKDVESFFISDFQKTHIFTQKLEMI